MLVLNIFVRFTNILSYTYANLSSLIFSCFMTLQKRLNEVSISIMVKRLKYLRQFVFINFRLILVPNVEMWNKK